MAGAAVDCASDGAMDRTHLFLPGHNGERRPERGQPLVYSHPDRAWFVAGAGAHRAGTGAAAQCVAGRDDTVHVMAGGYLGGGDQRRVPGRDQPDPDTADTVGDLSSGHRRRAYIDAVAAARAAARREAGGMALPATGLSGWG